jgi:hypothetical protein
MHSSGFTGLIRIRPALNEDERGHLQRLAEADGTLRGTPTGRGDRDVPFAQLDWDVCAEGCCLSWNPGLEDSTMMAPTLRFVIDHLLRRGAKAEGRSGFDGFTFDHVLDGAVMGGEPWERELRLVEVVGNVVTERLLPGGCSAVEARTPVRTSGVTRRGKLPKNVIEFRPRRA